MTAPRQDDSGWKFYQAAMKGRPLDPPIPRGIVPIGYYRRQERKTGAWTPVAIWVENGAKHVLTAGKNEKILETAEMEEDYDTDVFAWLGKHPISHKEYLHWIEHGKWSEDSGLNLMETRAEAAGANIGHNSGAEPDALTLEFFKDKVESATAQAAKLTKITAKDEADKAQGYRTRLTALTGEGDAQRKKEKEPHFKAGQAVDQAWNPLIDTARDEARRLKDIMDTFADAEDKRIRKERAAEAAKGQTPVEAPEPMKFQGAQGRKSSTKVILVPAIVDQDAVYAALKNNPEVIALLNKLVKKVYAIMSPGMPDMGGVTHEERTITT